MRLRPYAERLLRGGAEKGVNPLPTTASIGDLGRRFFDPEPAKHRLGTSQPDDRRSPAERDLARVLHSGAFRRLQGKSQVVRTGHADFFRTRLTHTLEVAQIGRAIATNIGYADPTLVELACLIHDLGHPPFGHNGEEALRDWMEAQGSSFEGNPQSFRIIANLEVKHPPEETGGRRVGLNLRLESLWASLKYPWPQAKPDEGAAMSGGPNRHTKFGWYANSLEAQVAARIRQAVLDSLGRSGAEAGDGTIPKHPAAVIMDWADDVAYSVHDLEDGVRAGLIPLAHLTTLQRDHQERREIVQVALGEHVQMRGSEADGLELLDDLMRSGPVRRCATPYRHSDDQRGYLKQMTSALIEAFAAGLHRSESVATIELAGDLMPDPRVKDQMALLKALTWQYVILRPEMQTLRYRERRLIQALCAVLLKEGDRLLPDERQMEFTTARLADGAPDSGTATAARARVVCDYVAGMTDSFAERMYARLLGDGRDQYITDLL